MDLKAEPPLDLAKSVLGETDRAGRRDAFETRGDIDAVAHKIAVALLDNVTQVDTNAEFDAALGRQPGVAFDEPVLHFDRAAHGVDHAPEFDEAAVAGSLDDAAVMRVDRRIDQIAP